MENTVVDYHRLSELIRIRYNGLQMARPNLSYLKNLILVLIGLPCGALTGLMGISSSVATIPLLRFLLGLQGARINACALSITFFCGLGALLSYSQSGNIHISTAVLLAVGQVFGAAWGQSVSARSSRLKRLAPLWSLLVLGLGVDMLIKPTYFEECASTRNLWIWHGILISLLWTFSVGIAVGFVSSLFKLGGVLIVPASIVFLHLSPQVAQGTAIAVLIMASLPGLLRYVPLKVIDPQVATWVSFGGVFGSLIGAYYAVHTLSNSSLIMMFGVALVSIGLLMLKPSNHKIEPNQVEQFPSQN
jgi:uncharacterized membrane protein YfcA